MTPVLPRLAGAGARPPPPVATLSPHKRVALPHFASGNGAPLLLQSPRRHHHASNPERFESEDSLETALDKSVCELRAAKVRRCDSSSNYSLLIGLWGREEMTLSTLAPFQERILSCFERINLTQELFESELDETNAMVERLHDEQQCIARMYFGYFHFSALQIQRLYRGHRGRRVYRQFMAVKAVLRIQRGFRAARHRRQEHLKNFRVMCRKILRGMRGIREKEELSHKELLSRVNHNMIIETQWRSAMGVSDTESSLITALYRKKYMRKRIGTTFRQFFWIHSIVRYWCRLVPEPEIAVVDEEEAEVLDSDSVSAESGDHEDEDALKLRIWNEQRLAFVPSSTIRTDPNRPKARSSPKKALTREELRRKQQAYTQRIQAENAKHEAARVAQLEKQKEAARLAELEKKRVDDEHRLMRMAHANALREDLERRGLLAIKEFQSKKDEEARKQEEAKARLIEARHRIAAEVLSDETQQLLKRKRKPRDC